MGLVTLLPGIIKMGEGHGALEELIDRRSSLCRKEVRGSSLTACHNSSGWVSSGE